LEDFDVDFDEVDDDESEEDEVDDDESLDEADGEVDFDGDSLDFDGADDVPGLRLSLPP
jgi:hypothetical protein